MSDFELPDTLRFNRGQIQDPASYFGGSGCASWLYLIGDEFAEMPGGMAWKDVMAAAPESRRVISDPPRTLDLDLARQHVQALDELPRPTLISCRAGPRASAVAYLYAGLERGADPAEVLEVAERDGAPFVAYEDYKLWVREAMEALRAEKGSPPPPTAPSAGAP